MSGTGGCGLEKDELTHLLRILCFAITGTTLEVCWLDLAGLLSTQATDLDLTVLLATSAPGSIVAWLLYTRWGMGAARCQVRMLPCVGTAPEWGDLGSRWQNQ